MNIALFGGSFDPIHNGHVWIIREALNLKFIDEVWLMLVPQGHHFSKNNLSEDKMRLNLIRKVFEGNKKVKVRLINTKINPNCSPYVELINLREKFKDNKFLLLISSETLKKMKSWANYTELIKSTDLILALRDEDKIKKQKDMKIKAVISKYKKTVSSSLIKERLKKNISIKGLVPKIIEEFIVE